MCLQVAESLVDRRSRWVVVGRWLFTGSRRRPSPRPATAERRRRISEPARSLSSAVLTVLVPALPQLHPPFVVIIVVIVAGADDLERDPHHTAHRDGHLQRVRSVVVGGKGELPQLLHQGHVSA